MTILTYPIMMWLTLINSLPEMMISYRMSRMKELLSHSLIFNKDR